MDPADGAGAAPGRWRRAQQIFDELFDLDAETDVDAYLASACAGDAELRGQVDELIRAGAAAPSFFSQGVMALIAPLQTTALDDQAPAPGPHSPDGEPRVGDQIGRYRLTELLGRGGMGLVYRAVRESGDFEHEAAIKVLRTGGSQRTLTARFEQERRVLATLSHPGIARLYDGGITRAGRPYIVMEYVCGTAITRYCDSHRLTLRGRLDLVMRVAEALQHAHRNLVVHRDLKPSNILVTHDGQVKLLDFGIAKLLDQQPDVSLTVGEDRVLTPGYSSPEQIRGEPVTVATDVYQLGVVMYELLCGRPPHAETFGNYYRLCAAITEQEPPPPSRLVGGSSAVEAERLAHLRDTRPAALRRALGGDLDAIVARALAKLPEHRYASMEAMCADILAYTRSRPVQASTQSLRYRARRFVGRHRIGVAAAAAFLLVLAGYLTTMLIQADRIARALEASRVEARKSEQVSAFLTELFTSSDPDSTRGPQVTARELLDAGESRIRDALADAPLVRAHLLKVLGTINYSLGAYPRSAELLQESVDTLRRHSAADVTDRAAGLTQLGIALTATDRFEDAAAAFEEAISLWRRRPEDPAPLGEALNAYALLLRRAGEPERAQRLFGEAIALLREVEQGENAELAVALNNLSILAFEQSRYVRAEALRNEAVRLQERILGPDHSYYSVGLTNLGRLLTFLGRYEEAQPKLQRALALQEQNLGVRHPYVARTLQGLGELAFHQGELDEARRLLQRALELQRNSGETAATAATLRLLGPVLQARGDYPGAEAAFTQMLEIDRRVYPPRDPRIGRDLTLLAGLARARGDHDTAGRLLAQALPLVTPQSRYAAQTHLERARLELVTGRRGAAEQATARARRILARTLPPGHPRLAELDALRREIAATGSQEAAGVDRAPAGVTAVDGPP